jgi:hypothetical protein
MAITIYKSYMFKTKDPVIDEMRTLLKEEGLLNRAGFKTLHERGAATPGTYNKWFNGDTRRPQNAAVMATAHAAGYERKWVKRK